MNFYEEHPVLARLLTVASAIAVVAWMYFGPGEW
jgi:hypothetical protein